VYHGPGHPAAQGRIVEEQAMSAELVYKGFTPEIKEIDDKKKSVTHLISNRTADRAGDIVSEDGWVTDHYSKNPIVLADHTYSIWSIIGKATRLSHSDEGLIATTQFHDKGLGAEAFELVKAKMARAWSVGFKGIKYTFITDDADKGCAECIESIKSVEDHVEKHITGRHFKKQELLEYSLVAIGMNPDIVMEAIQSGLVSKRYVPLLFDLDIAAIHIPGFDKKADVKEGEKREDKKTKRSEPDKSASDSSIAALHGSSKVYDAILDLGATLRKATLDTEIKKREDNEWVRDTKSQD
jgi:hypothetical protein